MKKLKKIPIAFFICLSLFCGIQYGKAQAVGTPYLPLQEAPIPFSFLAGGSNFEVPASVANTTDGGYITMTSTLSLSLTGGGEVPGAAASRGNIDWLIINYDHYGKIQWQRFYGGPQADRAMAILQTSDGGYIMTGSVGLPGGDLPTGADGNSIVVVKLDAAGAISWQKKIVPTGWGFAAWGKSIVQTADMGYLIGTHPFGVIKLDSAGNFMWERYYTNPGPNPSSFELLSTTAASDGTGYLLTGFASSTYRNPSLSNDAVIQKIDLAGNIVWQKLYGGNGSEEAFEVVPMSDGDCVITGYSTSSANGDVVGSNHGGTDVWVLRLDVSGNIVWQRLLGGSGEDKSYSITNTADGGLMLASYSSSSANGDITGTVRGSYDVWLVKLNSAGTIQWQKLYGGDGVDGLPPAVAGSLTTYRPLIMRVRETSDGGFVVAAVSQSDNSFDVTDTHNGGGDIWLFKIDASGNIISVPDIGQRL